MTDIIIKQAQEKDIPIIEEIMIDVVNFLDSIGQPQWKRQNVSWQGLSRYFKVDDFYIASIDDSPVGCFALIDYDPTFWPDVAKGTSLFIHKLAVKRCGSKQGVSKALIDFAKTQAVKLGINEVRLDTHQFRDKVRAIYEREGFICVGEKCLYEKYHTAFYVWKTKTNIIHIRLATPADAPDMAEVHMRSWEVAYKGILPDEYIREKNATRHDLYARVITEENETSFVIQYGGKTIGIMCVAPPQDKELTDCYELHYIYLHPGYFRRGIGTQAMELAYNIARSLGKTGLVLWVLENNTNSIEFYKKCGFVADGGSRERNFDKPLRSIRMRKEL